jgi:hypothetical protein
MFSYIAKKVTLGEVFIVGAILSVIFAVLWHFGGNKRQAEIAIVS